MLVADNVIPKLTTELNDAYPDSPVWPMTSAGLTTENLTEMNAFDIDAEDADAIATSFGTTTCSPRRATSADGHIPSGDFGESYPRRDLRPGLRGGGLPVEFRNCGFTSRSRRSSWRDQLAPEYAARRWSS
jgi:hypothetical protein